MGCRNLAHVVLDVGPSARSSQQVPAAIQYADAAPLAPRLACLGLPPVAVPAAGEVVCCTWAGASCRPAPARRTAPCVAPPSPPPPMHALLPMLPVPRPDPQPSFLPSCPAWTSAPPSPRLGAGPPLATTAPAAPSLFPRQDGHDQGCPAGCQPAPAAHTRFPAIPHRVARGRVVANLPPPPPLGSPARPSPRPRRQAAAPWPPAYADLSTLAGRGSGRSWLPPSSPPPRRQTPLQPPSSPPPRRQTAPARPNSYIQTTGPPPQWSG